MKNWQFFWIMTVLLAIDYDIDKATITLQTGAFFMILALLASILRIIKLLKL